MAWTDVSTGDTIAAAHINDIHQAWNGTAGKAQAMSLTEIDDAANYAFDARNKDATNSLIARFRNAANEVVLSLVKEAVNTAKQIVSTVADGTAPFVITSTTKVDNLHVARATLADTVAANSVGNAGLRQSVATSVVGRGANSTGNVADISAGTNGHVLRRSGDTVAFGTVSGAGIANDAIDSQHYVDGSIDTAHYAADSVDDTVVGNRVPQFYRRQGGSATDWSVAGTTTYTPTTVRMQSGVATASYVFTEDETDVAITFPVAFSNVPNIVATISPVACVRRDWYAPLITARSASGFTMTLHRGESDLNEDLAAVTVDVHWLAIGPE